MMAHADAAHKHKIVLLNWFAPLAPSAPAASGPSGSGARTGRERRHALPADVPDPYYEEDAAFEEVFDMMDAATDGLLEAVRLAVFDAAASGSSGRDSVRVGSGGGAGATPAGQAPGAQADPETTLRRLVHSLQRGPH
jgi:hypothetical protein